MNKPQRWTPRSKEEPPYEPQPDKPWVDNRHKVRPRSTFKPPTAEETAAVRRNTLEFSKSSNWWKSGADRLALIQAGRVYGPVDCVYFVKMGDTDACKIGLAGDGLSRLSGLQSGSPVPLSMVAWVGFFDKQHLRKAERFAHARAQILNNRLKGEWFRLSQSQIAKVLDEVVDEFREHIFGIGYDGAFYSEELEY